MKKKKLYLVSRETTGYDEFDSAVICAYSPKWALSDNTTNWEKVKLIGYAINHQPLGSVITSFNAG